MDYALNSLVTIDKVECQVVTGSSTLSIGTPISVNNVIDSLTTDAAGSTVLHAGDLITTLPEPTVGEVCTVVEDTSGQLRVVTSVVGGTIMCILAGQALAPGQPVTLGDAPISIAFEGDKTVLYVDERTTATLSAADFDIQIISDWGYICIGLQRTAADSDTASAEPTSTRLGVSQPRTLIAALAYLALGVATVMVTF